MHNYRKIIPGDVVLHPSDSAIIINYTMRIYNSQNDLDQESNHQKM